MSVELGQDAGVVTTPVTPPSWQRSLAAVVRSGLHFERHAPLTWGGGLGATCALVAAMWPSVADSIGKAVESYPAGIKQAFGIQELNSVEQYVDVEMLSLVVPLALAFFAVRCAIAGHRRGRGARAPRRDAVAPVVAARARRRVVHRDRPGARR